MACRPMLPGALGTKESGFCRNAEGSLGTGKQFDGHQLLLPPQDDHIFAEQEPDTVRFMFQKLLDPEADVIEQIQNFKQNADALLSRYQLKESMKQHYQGDRTICTYSVLCTTEPTFSLSIR